jgi:hypothetical protein
MTGFNWNLDVLRRAVHYRNLSAASTHVGLSQPQLSRIVQRLEEELGMTLLDRSVRRKSAWTVEAHRLAEIHEQNQRRLEQSIRILQTSGRAIVLHMGTLEGLVEVAVHHAKAVFDQTAVHLVHLDVYDQNELDAKYLAGDLELILTARLPSKSKPKFFKLCGYQSLDWTRTNSAYKVKSSYEFGRSKRKQQKRALTEKSLVSNSLLARRTWLQEYGGEGKIPSTLQRRGQKGMEEVLLLGSEALDPKIWQSVEGEI